MALDPRIRQITETVNGQLTERTIRHAVYLERFKTQEVHKIVGMLNRDVLPDLLNQLEHRLNNIATRGIDTSVTTTQRLKYLTRSVHDTLREGFVTAHNGFKTDLIDLAHYEAEFTAAMVKQAVPFTIDFITPNRQLLRSIVTSRPMEGQLLRKWFSGLAGSTQTAVTRQLNIGLALGESVPDMMRRFRGTRAAGFQDGIVGGTRRQVEALVRTGTSHVVNHARMETYKENVDVLKGYQWVSTLDHRTSPICRSRDGKVYAFDADGKEAGPVPPAHFNCRSTTVPLTKSWEELGISGMKEPPAGTRAAREYSEAKKSMRGEVPATQTYGEWLKRQPADVQKQILGRGRYELFKDGKVSIDQFVDDRGKSLTLKQLRRIEAPTVGAVTQTGQQVREEILRLQSRYEKSLARANRIIARDAERMHAYGRKTEFETARGFKDEEFDPLNDAFYRSVKRQNAIMDAYTKRARDSLYIENHGTLDVNLNMPMTPETRQAILDGKSFVERVAADGVIGKNRILIDRAVGTRAYATDASGNVQASVVSLDLSASTTTTVVHELGHCIEYGSKEVRRWAFNLLEKRAIADASGLKKIGEFEWMGTKHPEYAWEDKFIDRYAGKLYTKTIIPGEGIGMSTKIAADMRATEIVSMGIEWLYRCPIEFARKDPEFFEQLINILRGLK